MYGLRHCLLLGVIVSVCVGVLVPQASPAQQAPTVPAEFADLYASLDSTLKAADTFISSRWNGEKYSVIFSAELPPANGNAGEALLRAHAMDSVIVYLDRMQLLGIGGVKVAIKYPMLVPTFPRAAEYLDFFKRVSKEAHRRNLKLLAQMTTVFREPAFSTLPVANYYARLSLDRYKREKRQMAEVIIREIQPDYLTIENEPGTQRENTGLPFTVQTTTEIVQDILYGLDRADVLIGAGAGTWDDIAYFESLAQNTTIDYLDVHIYPINRDYLISKTFRIADIAHRAHKKLVLGEAWLYKVRDRELGGAAVAAAPALFARDVFSFWEPLDAAFVATIGKLAHSLQAEFVSFFWSRHFYGYVDYNTATRSLPPTALFQQANVEASRNMLMTPPHPTRTGLAFQSLTAARK